MSPFSRHTSYARLADLAEKRLTPEEQASIESHLAECKHCAQQLALLNKMMDLMRRDKTEGARTDAFQWVSNLMRPRAAASGAGNSPIRKIIAVLRSELAPFTPVFGERSVPNATRQLFYEAEGNALDLQIAPLREGLALAGQILGSSGPGEVELSGSGGSMRTRLGESGEFNLAPVAGGNYKLFVRWSDLEIEVPELILET